MNIKNHNRYSMSFTAGTLLQKESLLLAEVYGNIRDWGGVLEYTIATNLLQSRTSSTLKRQTREVISRIKCLSQNELSLLSQSSSQDQANLLWIAICRRYKFIADFATEVLHERYVTLNPDLKPEHFDRFFNRKAEWHPELEKLTDSTRQKLRQVLFKMMQQAGLINAQGDIIPAWISPEFVKHVENPSEWMWFPVFEADIPKVRV
ncbi:MAG: DUF1819 family protein [Thiotrichales bacterium]|nr:DUF1819 family protein [Thiotrichales bacterium]